MEKAKTRQEMADEYGYHRNTFAKVLKDNNITLTPGLLTLKEQELIYEKLGRPYYKRRSNKQKKTTSE